MRDEIQTMIEHTNLTVGYTRFTSSWDGWEVTITAVAEFSGARVSTSRYTLPHQLDSALAMLAQAAVRYLQKRPAVSARVNH